LFSNIKCGAHEFAPHLPDNPENPGIPDSPDSKVHETEWSPSGVRLISIEDFCHFGQFSLIDEIL
jgi:hypothetical protein